MNPAEPPRGTSCAVLTACVVLCAFGVLATTVKPLRLDQIRDRAGAVVIGMVTSTSAGTALNGALAVDEYRIAVSETLRGARVKDVTVRIPRVDGAPRLRPSTQYIFFLGPEPARPLVSLQQGIFRVENVTVAGKPTTVVITGANEPLVVSADGVLRLGGPVTIENRRLTPMQSARSVDFGAPDMPTGAERVSPVPAPASTVVKQSPARRYSTLADLRRFVLSGAAPEARRTR